MVRLYWLCIALLLSWEYFCSVFYDLPCLQLPGQSGSMGHQKKNGKMFVRNDVVPNWDEKPQRDIIFLCCKNLGCPLHSSSYMDFKVHMLRDISYSTCIKSMKTKPVITLIFLSSPQVYTKKLVGAQSSLRSYTHSLWGTTRFSLPPLLWCQAGTWSPGTETAFSLYNCNEIFTEKQGTGTGQQLK